MRSLYKGVLFFSLEHCLWKELNHNFFYYVLDIWMEMIYDWVTNGLARLNLPLELNFLCIGLCQIILVLWFSMHYVHENIVVGIDLWWFLYIIQNNVIFLDFLRHCFQFCCLYFGRSIPGSKIFSVYSWFNFLIRTLAARLQGHVRCPVFHAPDNLLPDGNTETPPRVVVCPGKRRES